MLPDLNPTPPYYAVHFKQVLDGVEQHYGQEFTRDERAFLDMLRALPPHAFYLYARLCNRHATVFRVGKLAYSECKPLGKAFLLLCNAGLAAWLTGTEENAASLILPSFTFAELRDRLPGVAPRFARRTDCLKWIAGWEGASAWVQALVLNDPILQPSTSHWRFFTYLYFGEMTENLSGFVVRELGHIVGEEVPADMLKPCFASRDEAWQCYRMDQQYEAFRARRDVFTALEVVQWWQETRPERNAIPLRAQARYDRLVARLAGLLERGKHWAEALALYETSPAPPSREKQLRLQLKIGNAARAHALCEEMLGRPCNEKEFDKAQQWFARHALKQKRSATRTRLAETPITPIALQECSVEEAALQHLRAAGWEGVHSENWLWSALFGLLLWDIIYDPAHGGFHQPLQLAPADLKRPEFYSRRRSAIEARLEYLHSPEDALAQLLSTAQQKQGIANPFLNWQEDTLPLLVELVTRVPGAVLVAALRRMAGDFGQNSSGFPDLFVWRGRECRFLEVKSPNDQLAPHQLRWIDFLSAHGASVELLRVLPTDSCTGTDSPSARAT